MTKGVCQFAINNNLWNYFEFALANCKQIKSLSDLKTCIITDQASVDANKDHPCLKYVDDIVIKEDLDRNASKRRVYDADQDRECKWFNWSRPEIGDLSPYDQTLLIDADLMIYDTSLFWCFDTDYDLLFTNQCHDATQQDKIIDYKRVYKHGIPLLWATVFYFRKNDNTQQFFDLWKYVRDHNGYYSRLFNYNLNLYRNDYSQAVARHIWDANTEQANYFPNKVQAISDNTKLIQINKDNFVIAYRSGSARFDGKWQFLKIPKQNIHFMNKFDLKTVAEDIIGV